MGVTVTGAQLRAIGRAPVKNLDALASAYNAHSPKYGLDVEHRAEQFLAQIAHESGGFRYVREVWGPTKAQLSYQGRMGNTRPGDGKLYMGRTLIQITGAENTRAFYEWCKKRYPDVPDFVRNPAAMEAYPWALIGAFWYWDSRKLNDYADKGDDLTITKRINGGTNGLADRRLRLSLAQKAITSGTAIPLAPVPVNDNKGRRTLRRGSKWTADVYVLQKALGMPHPDGKFGPLTEAAVVGYQRAHGLLPDGVAGPGTWASLDATRAAA